MFTRKSAGFYLSIFLLLLALLFPLPALADGKWLSFGEYETPEGTPPIIKVLEDDSYHTTLEITIPGIWVEEVNEGGYTFQKLELPDFATLGDIGKPAIPAIGQFVGFLEPSTNNIEYKDEEKVVLEDILVYSAQTPQVITPPAGYEYPFDFDQEFYSQDIWYPQERANVSKTAIMREVCIAHTGIVPFEYNPAKRELIVHPQMLVTVYHEPGAEGYGDWTPPLGADTAFAGMYRNLIVNYDNLGMAEMDCSINYNYIIISPQIFTLPANNLALYLNQHGYSVEVISQDTTNWEEIYSTIQYCYSQYHNIFVLLFGDVDFIPIPKIENPAYDPQQMDYFEHELPTDSYYADVNYPPPDYPSPDVIIGRLSVRDQNQAVAQVNKIKQHYDYWDPDLELKELLVAHGQYLYPPPWLPFVECKQYIRAFHYLITPNPSFTCIFGNDEFVDNQDIIDAINDGQMTVNYIGHGAQTVWSQWDLYHYPDPEDFGGPEIQQTNPGLFRPVIFSVSCLTGDITFKSSCMSELWMNASGGAVGVIASTRTVYVEPGILFDKWLYKALYRWAQGYGVIPCLGIIQECAKMKVVEAFYNYDWPKGKLLYYQFLLLGDPSLWMLPQMGIVGAGNNKKASEQKIKSTECSQLKPMLNLYPNPVSENMTVHITNAESGTARLEIYDLSGRLISDQEFIAGEGDTYFDVDFTSLNIKSGIYIVKLSAPVLYEVRRIVFTKLDSRLF